MKISQLIARLEKEKNIHGDLKLTTWDGDILDFVIRASSMGILDHFEEPDELFIEILVKS